METKRLIVVMLVGMAVILAWPTLVDRIARLGGYELPKPPAATQRGDDPAAPTTQASTRPAGVVVDAPPAAPTSVGGWTVGSAAALPAVETIGSAQPEDPIYALQLAVSSRGAGLEHAVLNNYKLTLKKGEPFTFQHPGTPPFADQTRSLAIRGVTVDGAAIDLTGQNWALVAADRDPTKPAQTLRYELPLSRGGNVDLVLRRTFSVYRRDADRWKNTYRDADAEPLGFEAGVVTSFENRTDRPMQVSVSYNAQLVPPTDPERLYDTNVLVGFARDGVVVPVQHSADSIVEEQDLLADASGRRAYWIGASTAYFMAMERFEPLPKSSEPSDWFGSVKARTLTPARYGGERLNEIVVTTKGAAIAPRSESGIQTRAYFGPRKREFLTNAHYSAPWVQYDRALVIISGFCGICTWQWLINILFFVLKSFHTITRDWGLAIIGLVVLVRLALHPITKRAQLNMLKFGKLAPEMTKIKERHKDDPDAMNRAMMGFYKEHGTTQVMGCLPMFLQMPVWIALWQAMNTTFELRQQPFFYGLSWIDDLSKPDHLVDFANYGIAPIHVPLLSFITITGVNVLPFLFGVLQFVQFKIQPKPPTMTEEQAQQQKMTQWMILIMMPIMLYASPAGLMIYMITSFLIGIGESKLVKRQFERMSENEAKFTIVEEGSPAAATAQKAVVRRKEHGPKKRGLFAMIEEARERAAELQRELERNRKKR